MGITDAIKDSVMESFNTTLSTTDIILGLLVSLAAGLFIVFIYRSTYAGVNYSRNFTGCLMMLSMVTTMVILVISSNMVLSLGMVGALSIVRFRTAVKEPTDTAFLFWAIATGIICGAGYVTISILATLALGLLFIALHMLSRKGSGGSYMVVARFDKDCDAETALSAMPGYRMKNKTMNDEMTELVAQMRLSKSGMEKLARIQAMPGVREISIMESVSGSVL